MAVYTLINKNQLESLLSFYDLGELKEYTPLTAGTTNSNYKLTLANNKSYVLTIIEQKLSNAELDFCIHYAEHLSKNNIPAAAPIKTHQGHSTISFLDKPVLITPFVIGESKISNSNLLKIEHSAEIGKTLSNMHKASRGFDLFRANPAGLTWCINAFKEMDDYLSSDNFLLIKEELEYQIINHELLLEDNNNNIKNITGAVHADLFCDNVIFANNKITGIIDFFYSCTDYYLYDLAIVVNEWALDSSSHKIINNDLYRTLMSHYKSEFENNNDLLTLTNQTEFWQGMLRQAALRFWLLRLNAFYKPNDSGIKTVKDPEEYKLKLLFHRENILNL
ncbi:MAG: phosphotransferase [Gammaproteobacteria bacterium]|nr:phosphotransferase [Gammaproteobacteria bacterium]